MTQGFRFLAEHELAEHLALGGDARIEILRHRGADGLDRARRRRKPARHRGHAGPGELQERFGLRMFARQIAHAPDRLGVLHQSRGEIARRVLERILGNRIEQRGALEGGRGNRRAGHDHVERRFEADEPRETLRAAGAGNQAELHFRKSDLRVGPRHPVVAAEREFESSAHAGAADRGDHRLAGAFDDVHDRGQEGIGIERAAGKFLDVCAAREGALIADDDYDPHLRICDRAMQRMHELRAQRMRQRVEWWIVHREPRDALFDFVADDLHGRIISTAASARRSGGARTAASTV